jgi:hypothetical protein
VVDSSADLTGNDEGCTVFDGVDGMGMATLVVWQWEPWDFGRSFQARFFLPVAVLLPDGRVVMCGSTAAASYNEK